MKCKNKYADKKKYADYKRRYQERYREKTGSNKYEKRSWTAEEDKLVMSGEFTDRELSERICRSVAAIQIRRHRIVEGEV